jgi:Zn finger protein HypA/HybF involved in hydrogenase expression
MEKAITLNELMQVSLQLPSHIDKVVITGTSPIKEGAYEMGKLTQVLMNGIRFAWIEETKEWQCLHPIRVKGSDTGIMLWCEKCKKRQPHIVNKTSTKIKCDKCQMITPLNL